MHHHVLFGFKVILGIFVSIALALAFFYIGFNTGYLNGFSLGQNQGWLTAKQTVEKSGLFPVTAGVKILSLSGTVINVKGNKISLKTDNLNINPLDSPTPAKRIVTVTDNSKLIRQILKTPEEMQNDLEKFRKAQEEFNPDKKGSVLPEPPLPYTETNFNIKDLRAGDSITVNSDIDIRNAAEFKAKEIRWQTAAKTAPAK